MDRNELLRRKKELDGILRLCEESIAKMPSGNLRISKDGNKVKYFHVVEKGDTHGKYIRKQDVKLAEMIAQRDYYTKVAEEAKREIKAIDMYLKNMSDIKVEDVFDSLNGYRQALVNPVILSDKEYARRWENETFKTNPFESGERVYETKKGEKVRSKSEAMIADMYFELGIPYRYECEVALYNGKVKYPDFTLLKISERKLIYHEHMGMLEDDFYRKNNLIKLNEYSKSGIFCCDNLIISFETEYAPLNIKEIRKMVKKVLK